MAGLIVLIFLPDALLVSMLYALSCLSAFHFFCVWQAGLLDVREVQ
jgi:hypothetical protein